MILAWGLAVAGASLPGRVGVDVEVLAPLPAGDLDAALVAPVVDILRADLPALPGG